MTMLPEFAEILPEAPQQMKGTRANPYFLILSSQQAEPVRREHGGKVPDVVCIPGWGWASLLVSEFIPLPTGG